MSALWYHGTEADPEAVANDFEHNNLDPTGAAPSWQYWFAETYAAVGYYGPNAVEATLLFENPLRVTCAEFDAARIGPVSWANKAFAAGHDAVVIEDIMDGDTIATVCAVFDPDLIRARPYARYNEATDHIERINTEKS